MNLSQRYFTAVQQYELELRKEIYEEVFHKHLNLEYQINQIQINEYQSIHTVFLRCTDRQQNSCENYYVGHGFGGSSILYFYLITDLLKKGNVVLWEIRGMGLSIKIPHFVGQDPESILNLFLEGIAALFCFYNHSNSSVIAHSFSSYLMLHFTIRRQVLTQRHIKEILLLSPVGITTKEDDYRYKSNNCHSIFQHLFQKCIWFLNSNFKTPYKFLCSPCCKDYFLKKMIIQQIQLEQKQAKVMKSVASKFLELSNGTQNFFFQLFQPHALPKIPVEPLLVKEPCINITIVFGGEKDWADKTGATKIAQRFPNKIKKIQVENASHNIAFHTSSCRALFEFILK